MCNVLVSDTPARCRFNRGKAAMTDRNILRSFKAPQGARTIFAHQQAADCLYGWGLSSSGAARTDGFVASGEFEAAVWSYDMGKDCAVSSFPFCFLSKLDFLCGLLSLNRTECTLLQTRAGQFSGVKHPTINLRMQKEKFFDNLNLFS